MSGESEERTLLVDASVFIRLAEIRRVQLLRHMDGEVEIPRPVAQEIVDGPAARGLEAAEQSGWISVTSGDPIAGAREAATYLGAEAPDDSTDSGWIDGDIALLARALAGKDATVVVSDDKPLRRACKSLGIELSGSIGVLVAAVERGHLGPETAKHALEAMDEVGARLSASLFRRAERLIDEAAED